MDPELLKLIGPYGKKLNLNFGTTKSSPRFQSANGSSSKAGSSKLGTVSGSTPKPGRAGTLKQHREVPTKTFEPLYKKTTAKFLQGADSKRSDRVAEMEMRRKARRTETLMVKRNVDVKEINSLDLVEVDGESSTDDSGISSGNQNANVGVPEVTKKIPNKVEATQAAMVDARRERLLKWKKEKEAVQEVGKAIKKPPFRAGAQPIVRNPKNGVGAPAPLSGSNATSTVTNRNRPIPVPVPANAKSAVFKPVAAGTERRVTRAMAKVQPEPVASSNIVLKPTINKLKNLNLDAKPPHSGVVKPPTLSAAAPKATTSKDIKAKPSGNAAKGQVTEINKGVGSKKPVSKVANSVTTKLPTTNTDSSSTKTSNAKKIIEAPVEIQQNIAPPIPAVIAKKLKPKGIDPVFTEHNANFAKACELLSTFLKYWTNVIETNQNIPEDIRDDIISALGKVKLLLQSKLPQFSELLYSYLCKEMDPGPILECDLQGWWDVAYIQVEAITKEFGNLKLLESNNWVQEAKAVAQIPQKKKPKNSDSDSTKTPNKPKPQASKGMQAFLAMKRKAIIKQDEEADVLKLQEKPATSPVMENKFEGGFFVISSPVHTETVQRRSSRRLTAIENRSLSSLRNSTTPSRRQSISNISLRMLSMRNSLGPMLKIGARPALYSEVASGSASSSQAEEMDITE